MSRAAGPRVRDCRKRPAGTCRPGPRRRGAARPRLDPLTVDVCAVEAADVAHREACTGARRNSACRRETVTSSRKMSLPGCRPTVVTSASSRNRLHRRWGRAGRPAARCPAAAPRRSPVGGGRALGSALAAGLELTAGVGRGVAGSGPRRGRSQWRRASPSVQRRRCEDDVPLVVGVAPSVASRTVATKQSTVTRSTPCCAAESSRIVSRSAPGTPRRPATRRPRRRRPGAARTASRHRTGRC